MAFYRVGESQTLLVLANFRKESRKVTLPGHCRKVLLNNCDTLHINSDNSITLDDYQAVILDISHRPA